MNTAIIMGNLTRDPELTQVGDTPLVKFGLAWNNPFRKDKDDETSFFDVEAWGKVAEVINTHFKKGSRIQVSGNIIQNRWETSDGDKRSKHIIVARDFDFVDSKKESQRDSGGSVPEEEIPF